MSAFWGYRATRPLAAVALAMVFAAAIAPVADANVHVHGNLNTDKHRNYRVDVNGSNVSVTPAGSESSQSGGSGDGLVIDDGAGLVRIFSDANVAHGQHIDGDVVAVFGSVHVAGSVSGNTVAVFGSVTLDSSATVNGDAVAVGGGLDSREGAKVSGQSVSVGFLPLTFGLPALPLALMTLFMGWLVTALFGGLYGLLFPAQLARTSRTASQRTALSLVLGLLSGPFVPVATILLMVTVIGLPFGLLLPFVWMVATFIGHIAATRVLGAKILRRGPGEGSAFAPIAAGATFVAAFFIVGVFLWQMGPFLRSVSLFFFMAGLLIHMGLSAIGCGAVLLSRFGTRRDTDEISAGAPASGPAPEPGGVTVG